MKHGFWTMVWLALTSLLLGGCTDQPQDFIVAKPASTVYQALSSLEMSGSQLGNYSMAINTISVDRQNNNQITYHLASEKVDKGTTIRFDITAIDPNTSKVQVHYDVPGMNMGDGSLYGLSPGPKELSARRVKRNVGKDLKSFFNALEGGFGYHAEARELNLTFMSLSLATNPDRLAAMVEGKGDYVRMLANILGDGDGGRSDYAASTSNINSATTSGRATDSARPMNDAGPMLDPDEAIGDY
ncbi:MAG: hypothetical protein AAFX04_12770 [Pseudomonadota bacterium]